MIYFRLALPGDVPRWVATSHPAFNPHTFRPYYFSQFSEKSGCFTSGQRADIFGSWYIFRYQLEKGTPVVTVRHRGKRIAASERKETTHG